MFAILAAFGIMKFILKQYFKIDFTSFKGAITGAGILSGKAIFDSIGKPLGLIKRDDEAFENASSKGDLKKALSSLFSRDDKGEDEEEQKKADDNLTNVKGNDDSPATDETAPESSAETDDDNESPDDKALVKTSGGRLANGLADTILEGENNFAPKPEDEKTDEWYFAEAEKAYWAVAGNSGLLHSDVPPTPEQVRKNFAEAISDETYEAGIKAMEEEGRTAVDWAFTMARAWRLWY